MDFDFDKWANLAKQDPHAFEARRKEMIDEIIKGFPSDSRHLSEGLQFRIDMERRRSKNPMESCIRISNMMKEQFYTDFYPTVGSQGANCPFDTTDHEQKKGAVIPFKKPADR